MSVPYPVGIIIISSEDTGFVPLCILLLFLPILLMFPYVLSCVSIRVLQQTFMTELVASVTEMTGKMSGRLSYAAVLEQIFQM